MALPEFLQPFFASYDLSALDSEQDKELVITQVLVWGDKEATSWLLENYKLDELGEVIQKPRRGMWTRKALNYWQSVLEVETDQEAYSAAIMDMNPRPDVYDRIIP